MRLRRLSSRWPRAPVPALAVFLAGPLVAGLLLAAGCERAATSEAPVPAATAFSDTLALLDLHLATGVLDSVMASEADRPGLACPAGRAECLRANDPSRVVPLDVLRERPEARSPAAGVLAAHVHVTDSGWLAADLVFVPLPPTASTSALHLRPMGDWGYGVHLAVRHWTVVTSSDGESREWVRIPGAGSVGGGWLALGEGGLTGWMTPADEPVWAVGPEGRAELGLAFDHFRILDIADGWVTIRAEIPSDMACGPDPPPAPPNAAVTRLQLSDLFSSTGMPRIETAYPRGC